MFQLVFTSAPTIIIRGWKDAVVGVTQMKTKIAMFCFPCVYNRGLAGTF